MICSISRQYSTTVIVDIVHLHAGMNRTRENTREEERTREREDTDKVLWPSEPRGGGHRSVSFQVGGPVCILKHTRTMFFKSMDPLPQTNPSLTTPANLTVTASSWSAREHKKIRSASFREDLPTSTPSRRQSIPWCTFSVPASSRPECAQSCHRRIDAPLVFPLWQVDLVIYRHHIRVRIHQVRPVGCTHTSSST